MFSFLFKNLKYIFLSMIIFSHTPGSSALAAGIEFTYDSSNRLIKSVTTSKDKTATTEFFYDAAGNRINTVTTVENDTMDIQAMSGEFGTTQCISCQVDFDMDGDVDGADIAEMIQ